MKRNSISLGDNIRQWRNFRQIKSEELGRCIGVHKTMISHIENGNAQLSKERIAAVAAVLKIKTAQLYCTPEEWMEALSKDEAERYKFYDLLSERQK